MPFSTYSKSKCISDKCKKVLDPKIQGQANARHRNRVFAIFSSITTWFGTSLNSSLSAHKCKIFENRVHRPKTNKKLVFKYSVVTVVTAKSLEISRSYVWRHPTEYYFISKCRLCCPEVPIRF